MWLTAHNCRESYESNECDCQHSGHVISSGTLDPCKLGFVGLHIGFVFGIDGNALC
jgi:hypothetical protein